MRSKADQWDLHSIGTNHHDNFLGNNESSYEKKVRCQSYNKFFPKKLKKHPTELSGLRLFAWKNLVTVKNNELVVDYPKLPKKLNIILAREYGHEKPLELKRTFPFSRKHSPCNDRGDWWLL